VPRVSAGLLPWRRAGDGLELFLAHMGGPFWAGREEGAWSIVKGELAAGEEPLAAALREFAEETGLAVPAGPLLALTPVKQAGGKVVHAFALEAPDLDPAAVRSNTYAVEWPRGSGRFRRYPEIDRAAWLAPAEARRLLVKAQAGLVDELERLVSRSCHPPA
jgi:predicted NUDIX family NTP pyrophosphohydrolase